MKKILLLGASGSIGSQSLDIILENPNDFLLTSFSLGNRSEKVEEILEKFPSVKCIYLKDKDKAKELSAKHKDIKFFSGEDGLINLVKKADYDLCVNALVGFVGFLPSVEVLKKNKILCLANKETLVAGGTVINTLLKKGKGKLYPIDSEHVALAKCLSRCKPYMVDKLILTASGGALRDYPIEKLDEAKKEDALKHPNWKMGDKITIDCATMMNKGFEIIEAYYLFGYPLDKIEVMMHKESLIHSAVKLTDGSYIVDYGQPDMHNPIRWAMYEGRNKFEVLKIRDFKELNDCHFFDYDPKRYPLTELAKKSLGEGASKMIAMNASNEVAVNKFLKDEISYLNIDKIVESVVNNQQIIANPSIKQIICIDRKAREEANK